MAKMQKVTPDEVGGAFHAILEDYTDGVMEQIEAELPKLGRKGKPGNQEAYHF